MTDAEDERLAEIRNRGWMVAVHNDYMIGRNRLTFWLFTHPELGRFAKGEGSDDAEALSYVAHRIGEIENEMRLLEVRTAAVREYGSAEAAVAETHKTKIAALNAIIELYKAEIKTAEAKGYGQGYAMCLHDWRKVIEETEA